MKPTTLVILGVLGGVLIGVSFALFYILPRDVPLITFLGVNFLLGCGLNVMSIWKARPCGGGTVFPSTGLPVSFLMFFGEHQSSRAVFPFRSPSGKVRSRLQVVS